MRPTSHNSLKVSSCSESCQVRRLPGYLSRMSLRHCRHVKPLWLQPALRHRWHTNALVSIAHAIRLAGHPTLTSLVIRYRPGHEIGRYFHMPLDPVEQDALTSAWGQHRSADALSVTILSTAPPDLLDSIMALPTMPCCTLL